MTMTIPEYSPDSAKNEKLQKNPSKFINII